MKNKIMGKISFGYSDLIMPLEIAHKIQAMLAEHAVRFETNYGANRVAPVSVIREYEVGSVEVLKNVDFDARGVSSEDYSAWANAIRDREEGDVVMSPQDFAKIKGGE